MKSPSFLLAHCCNRDDRMTSEVLEKKSKRGGGGGERGGPSDNFAYQRDLMLIYVNFIM